MFSSSIEVQACYAQNIIKASLDNVSDYLDIFDNNGLTMN